MDGLMSGSRDKRFGFRFRRGGGRRPSLFSVYGVRCDPPLAEDGSIVPYYSPWHLWGTPIPFFRALYLLFDPNAKIEIPLTDEASRTFLPLDGRKLNFRIAMTFLVGFALGAATVAAAMHAA